MTDALTVSFKLISFFNNYSGGGGVGVGGSSSSSMNRERPCRPGSGWGCTSCACQCHSDSDSGCRPTLSSPTASLHQGSRSPYQAQCYNTHIAKKEVK